MQRNLPSFYGPRKTVFKETCPHVMLLAFLTSQLLKPNFDWIYFMMEGSLLSNGLKCTTAIAALFMNMKIFLELSHWVKEAKPTWTLLCSQGSQRSGAVHMFFSLLSTSWFLRKNESENRWSHLNVVVVVTFECGCDDNWGIGIPFSQHWMPSTWCHKPLRQLGV